jgi:hypothetical protein
MLKKVEIFQREGTMIQAGGMKETQIQVAEIMRGDRGKNKITTLNGLVDIFDKKEGQSFRPNLFEAVRSMIETGEIVAEDAGRGLELSFPKQAA